MKKAALIGSWDPKWIEDHRRWLRIHRGHADGWKNRIGPANLELLGNEFYFYAYLPKSKGGSGLVEYRLRCSEAEYSKRPKMFRHEHGQHDDAARYPARLTFTIREIKELPKPLSIAAFTRTSGSRLRRPFDLVRVPVVWSPS